MTLFLDLPVFEILSLLPVVTAPLMTSASSTTCPTLTKNAMKMKKGQRCRGKFSPKLQGSCQCTQERGVEVSEAGGFVSLNLSMQAESRMLAVQTKAGCTWSLRTFGSRGGVYSFVLLLWSGLGALQWGLFPASASLRNNDEHCFSDDDLAAKVSCKHAQLWSDRGKNVNR